MTFEDQMKFAHALGTVAGVKNILESGSQVHPDITKDFKEAVEVLEDLLKKSVLEGK